MGAIKTVYIIGIVSAASACFALFPESMKPLPGFERKDITRTAFWEYLKGIPKSQLSAAGFVNADDITKASIKDPIHIYDIDPEKTMRYSGKNVFDILRKTDIQMFPITVRKANFDNVVSFLQAIKVGEEYQIQQICCSQTAPEFEKIASIWSKEAGFRNYLVRTGAGSNADFVAILANTPAPPTLTALPSYQKKFKRFKTYELKAVLPDLQKAATARLKKMGLAPLDTAQRKPAKERPKLVPVNMEGALKSQIN